MSPINANMRWVKKNEKLISCWLSIFILALFILYVLGFTFAHGLCCGDDADLALKAKGLAEGKFHNLYVGFDPHIGIIIPVAIFIKLLGIHYWVPGLSIVFLNFILLISIGLLSRKYEDDFRYLIAAGIFLLLNCVLTALHFEQWFAALGEVPAALLLIFAVLVYYHRRTPVFTFLSGLLFSVAILTKVATIVAFGAFLSFLFLQTIIEVIQRDIIDARQGVRNISLVLLGFLSPLILFGLIYVSRVGYARFSNRAVNTASHLWAYFQHHRADYIWRELIHKSKIFRDRFGIPIISVFIVPIAGWFFLRKEKEIIDVYYGLSTILLIYTSWWIFFSIGWGRHYTVPMVLLIFTAVWPLLHVRLYPKGAAYLSVLALWSLFGWKHMGVPIKNLNGQLFQPTNRTQNLLEVSGRLDREVDQDPVITKRHATFEDMQFMTANELKFVYFDRGKRYEPPFWIAVTTDFVGVNEFYLKYSASDSDAFKRLVSRCRGVRYYDDYLVGRCE